MTILKCNLGSWCVTFILALQFMQTCPASEGPAAVIITGLSPGWANEDGTGFASDLIHVFLSRYRSEYQFKVLPMRRAFKLMEKDKAACTVGGDAKAMNDVGIERQIYSRPFRRGGLVIYTQLGVPPPHNLKEAKRLRLGLEAGFDFRSVLAKLPNLSKDPASPEAQLRKMAIKRIDGYVGLFPPGKENAGKVAYDAEFLLAGVSATLHCSPSSRNAELVKNFNLFLDEYTRSGELRKLFDRYFDPAAWREP